jgi:transcriptional regulator with GAF, ATPase, and Fis domain
MTKKRVTDYRSSDKAYMRSAAVYAVHQDNLTREEALDALDKSLLIEALRASRGDQSAAARALGVHRNTIAYMCHRHGVTVVKELGC